MEVLGHALGRGFFRMHSTRALPGLRESMYMDFCSDCNIMIPYVHRFLVYKQRGQVDIACLWNARRRFIQWTKHITLPHGFSAWVIGCAGAAESRACWHTPMMELFPEQEHAVKSLQDSSELHANRRGSA